MAVNAPVCVKSIPNLVAFEAASFGPVDLKQFIQSPVGSGDIRFAGELANGAAFPPGLICTENGLISGMPAKGTMGEYSLVITAKNDADVALTVDISLIIRQKLGMDDPAFLNSLKSQIWQALGENAPVPELADFWDRPITASEIYYLLQRYAVLTIWDVFNLEVPGKLVPLQLEGNSSHYHIYDRGSCLVAAPKDLFSHARNLEDALQAARAMSREVYRRGWTIELAGFNKMAKAAWVELQHLGDKHGKKLEILHFEPTSSDLKLYQNTIPPDRPGLS